MRLLPLLALALAASLAAPAAAGCYRGRPRPVRAASEESWNWTPTPLLDAARLPRQFSWADVRGRSMIVPSWNQHEPQYCGSCYAHATLTQLADRLKIEKGGLGPDVVLSRQSFLNCAPPKNYSGGCDGGDVIDVYGFMKEYGLPDETCLTYSATDSTKYGKHASACPPAGFCTNCMPVNGADTCWPVKTPILYRVTSYGRVGGKGNGRAANERALVSELYARGPVVCSIATPEDFTYAYRGGVYQDPKNYTKDDVDHDIEVIGWGEDEDGTPYYLCRNSWGSFWGENGFFKIPRGTNSLFIEEGDCWAATVDWSMEKDVRRGKLVGTMFGVVPAGGADAGEGVGARLVKAAWAE